MDEAWPVLCLNAIARVEELIDELRKSHTIVIVTHNMQRAAHVLQRVACFHLGEMLECSDYVTGRFD